MVVYVCDSVSRLLSVLCAIGKISILAGEPDPRADFWDEE